MQYDEPLVAAVAIMLATIAVAIAFGPWDGPYQLRTIDAVKHRFGMSVARAVWVAVALTMFATGLAIVSGVRPTYAIPSDDNAADR